MTKEEQIIACENKLLNALRENDISTVDGLIHDNLLFNIPTGQTITKEIDLQNHRSGLMTINGIVPSEQVIKITDDIATVAVTIHLTGKYMDTIIDEHFRYLRVWKIFDENWKIVAGSSFQI
jgi:hypothetical protein